MNIYFDDDDRQHEVEEEAFRSEMGRVGSEYVPRSAASWSEPGDRAGPAELTSAGSKPAAGDGQGPAPPRGPGWPLQLPA